MPKWNENCIEFNRRAYLNVSFYRNIRTSQSICSCSVTKALPLHQDNVALKRNIQLNLTTSIEEDPELVYLFSDFFRLTDD